MKHRSSRSRKKSVKGIIDVKWCQETPKKTKPRLEMLCKKEAIVGAERLEHGKTEAPL